MPDPCAWQSKAVMRIVTRAKRRCLRTHLTITFALLAVGCAGIPDDALLRASDAPDRRQARAVVFGAPSSYADALAQWRSPESINAWIAANFEYDNRRALALSESARSTAGHIKIHEPEVFYVAPVGVCVDLANFAVSALRAVAPDLHPSFLLIEFEPVRVAGQTLRRHWLASYRQDGAFYFFADSKRPGHIAGPYGSVDQFVIENAEYRRSSIVTYRLMESHERRIRTLRPQAVRE